MVELLVAPATIDLRLTVPRFVDWTVEPSGKYKEVDALEILVVRKFAFPVRWRPQPLSRTHSVVRAVIGFTFINIIFDIVVFVVGRAHNIIGCLVSYK